MTRKEKKQLINELWKIRREGIFDSWSNVKKRLNLSV
jgi:hypothetical protein